MDCKSISASRCHCGKWVIDGDDHTCKPVIVPENVLDRSAYENDVFNRLLDMKEMPVK